MNHDTDDCGAGCTDGPGANPAWRGHGAVGNALDPGIAPGVGTPVPGGLTFREAHLLTELLADARIVASLDLVEVNPILGRENRTAKMMVELAASLLGRSIV
jgi:arginase